MDADFKNITASGMIKFLMKELMARGVFIF